MPGADDRRSALDRPLPDAGADAIAARGHVAGLRIECGRTAAGSPSPTGFSRCGPALPVTPGYRVWITRSRRPPRTATGRAERAAPPPACSAPATPPGPPRPWPTSGRAGAAVPPRAASGTARPPALTAVAVLDVLDRADGLVSASSQPQVQVRRRRSTPVLDALGNGASSPAASTGDRRIRRVTITGAGRGRLRGPGRLPADCSLEPPPGHAGALRSIWSRCSRSAEQVTPIRCRRGNDGAARGRGRRSN
ncbi:hypothetical protein HBB16_12005 [Pseudonocardia sp. MCCB 268]|nr:hypothetical protein [Pseudonocardia cytotoxica]